MNAFDNMADSDGFIHRSKLGDLFRSLGFKFRKSDLLAALSKLDDGGDGLISRVRDLLCCTTSHTLLCRGTRQECMRAANP